MFLLPGFECRAEAVEPRFPELPVLAEPGVDLAERLWLKRVEPTRSLRPHHDEACFGENAQMPRNTRLMDAYCSDQIVDLALAGTQRIDDAAARWVGKGEERIYMHNRAYAY